jgi:hypothetical protein
VIGDFFFTIGGEPRQVVIELGELDNGVEVVSPTASGYFTIATKS